MLGAAAPTARLRPADGQIRNALRICLEVRLMAGQAHVELRRALETWQCSCKPRQPLPMLDLRLGLDKKASGVDGMFAAALHGGGRGLMLAADAGGEVGEAFVSGKVEVVHGCVLPYCGQGPRRATHVLWQETCVVPFKMRAPPR